MNRTNNRIRNSNLWIFDRKDEIDDKVKLPLVDWNGQPYLNEEETINALKVGDIVRLWVGENEKEYQQIYFIIKKIKRKGKKITSLYGIAKDTCRTFGRGSYPLGIIETGELLRFKPTNIIEIPNWKANKKDSKIHNGNRCNNCKVFPIVGKRFVCMTCYDYDLCNKCYSNMSLKLFQEHKDHGFCQIKTPEEVAFKVSKKR